MSPPIVINVAQMVDLALGVGDHNTINLAVLHSLLHVVVKKLQIDDTLIEFRGQSHEVFEALVSEMPAEKYVKLQEFELKCEGDIETRVEVADIDRSDQDERIISVIRCGNRPKIMPPGFPLRTLDLAEIIKPSDEPPSIHNLIAETLPENNELIEARVEEIAVVENSSISGSQSLPMQPCSVLDNMWKLLNLSQRVEAVEISVKKLAELVQVIHDKAQEMITLIIECNLKETAKLVRVMECILQTEVKKITNLQIAVREIQNKICELMDGFRDEMEKFWDSKGMHDFSVEELNERLDDLTANKADKSALEDACSCIQRVYRFEEEFINSMADIQKMIDAKFDNCHVPDLKNFIEQNLMAFKTQLDYLSTLICDNSAGATYEILRNLKCISCKKLVSQRNEELFPPLPLMGRSIPQKVKTKTIARYCGGCHTLVKPNEKIPRSGNFYEEYGPPPPDSPINYVRGTDGNIFLGERPKVFRCCGTCAQCNYHPELQKTTESNEQQPTSQMYT